MKRWSWLLGLCLCSRLVVAPRADNPGPGLKSQAAEVLYTEDRRPEVPWSIHIVRVPRNSASYLLHAAHAQGSVLGLATVGEQARETNSELGAPVAAINGDFYEREGRYAGRPRGLQIMGGELISAPTGEASFWLDASGEPHTTNTLSGLQVTWPNGLATSIGLNEARRADQVVLYTPALGGSTGTRGGRELVLEREGETAWLPLRAGRVYRCRVREIRTQGDTPVSADTLVLSVGPKLASSILSVTVGAELQISTATVPMMRGVKDALGGGPVLVRDGKAQRLRVGPTDSYQASSAFERHPRSAVGWNEQSFFLVEVDGRQKQLSVGMTLNELAAYLVKLGCTDAMNLDGGGSATLWFEGKVCNHPCDGQERPVANALVVVKRTHRATPIQGARVEPLTP